MDICLDTATPMQYFLRISFSPTKTTWCTEQFMTILVIIHNNNSKYWQCKNKVINTIKNVYEWQHILCYNATCDIDMLIYGSCTKLTKV